MSMRARLTAFLAGGLVAAALAVAAAGAAFAQTPPPAGTPPASSAQQRADALLDAFAGKLGKTSAEVRAAIVAVQKDQVAQAVQQGRLTQAQADQLNQRIDQEGGRGLGLLGRGFGFEGRGAPKGGGRAGVPANGIPVDMAALAQFLGLPSSELNAALRSGKSLVQVAEEKGKSRTDLESHLTTQARNWVSQAVQQGRLTQAQGDQRLVDLDARIDRFVERVAPARTPTPRGTGA
jgi:hypothetical protein